MIRLVPAMRFRDDSRATRRIDDEPTRGRLAASILLVLDRGTLRIIHGSPKRLRCCIGGAGGASVGPEPELQ